MQHGRIVDYTAANHYLDAVLANQGDWSALQHEFAPILKQLKARIREQPVNEFHLSSESHFHFWNNARTHDLQHEKQEKPNKQLLQSISRIAAEGHSHAATLSFFDQDNLAAACINAALDACIHPFAPLVFVKSTSLSSEPARSEFAAGVVLQREPLRVVCRNQMPAFDVSSTNAEQAEGAIDWSSARVFPLHDGLLVTLYAYDGRWWISSEWDAAALGRIGFNQRNDATSVSQLFWQVWDSLSLELPNSTAHCYTFILRSNRHRVISNAATDALLLCSVTELDALREVSHIEIAERLGWPCVKPIEVEPNGRACLKFAESANPFHLAGCIACDSTFKRARFFSPQYVSLDLVMRFSNPGFGPMNMGTFNLDRVGMLELLRSKQAETLLAHFPQHRQLHDDTCVVYNNVLSMLNSHYEQCADRNHPHTREFAQEVAKQPQEIRAALFDIARGSFFGRADNFFALSRKGSAVMRTLTGLSAGQNFFDGNE
jgi:hypothetical protein